MAKTTAVTTEQSPTGFTPPFTLDQFKRDVAVLVIHQARSLCWMTDYEEGGQRRLLSAIGVSGGESINLYFPDYSLEDQGMRWESVESLPFARYLYSMYDYGCNGVVDTSLDAIEDDSAYSWYATLLLDLKQSAFMEEWNANGGEGKESARRCYEIAELANARHVLETGEPFSSAITYQTDRGDGFDQLNVRQLALLSGMEEMSIRSAANPTRPNPLPIAESAKLAKRTRFDVEVAKVWLKSKGKYVPITRQHKSGSVDLTTRRFRTIDELAAVVDDRIRYLATCEAGQSDLVEKMDGLLKKHGFEFLDLAALTSEPFTQELAGLAEFPLDLFRLRIRETLARSELARVEQELRELT